MFSAKQMDQEYYKGRSHAKQECEEIVKRHMRKAERYAPEMIFMLNQILLEVIRDV